MNRLALFCLCLALLSVNRETSADIVFSNTFDAGVGTQAIYRESGSLQTGVSDAWVERSGYVPSNTVGVDHTLRICDLGAEPGSIVLPLVGVFNSPPASTPIAFNSSHAAPEDDDYLSFVMQFDSGVIADFSSFTYSGNFIPVGSDSASDIDTIELRSSADGFANVINTSPLSLSGDTIALNALSLPTPGDEIEFRLYIQDSSNGVNEATCYDLDSFSFNGTITAVPEPSSFAMFLLSGSALLLRRRKR